MIHRAAFIVAGLLLACGHRRAQPTTSDPSTGAPAPAEAAYRCEPPSGGPAMVADIPSHAAQRGFPSAACMDQAQGLLARMTLAEKIGQMTQPDSSRLGDRSLIARRALGSVLSGGGSDPRDNSARSWALMIRELHEASLESRLQIPILYGIDAVHGHNNVRGAVLFPHNVGLGAARDPDLMKRMGRVVAREMRATGADWTFAPVVASARDERWGRTYEAFGETTELADLLAPPFITGLQGDDLSSPESVLACAKHYVGDGATRGGLDRGDAPGADAASVESMLESYRRAIDARVGSIMVSFSALAGVRMHCNGPLLSDRLKREMGFTGFLVSDWTAVELLPGENYAEQLEQSINAGLDMIMQPEDFDGFAETLESLVPQRVPVARIDDAAFRILSMKCEAGLLSPDRFRPDRSGRAPLAGELLAEVGSPEHRAVAREAARKSVVLLKNQDAVLPLSKSEGSLHLAGEAGDDMGLQCGGWTISWQGQKGDVTPGTTIRRAMETARGGAGLTYAEDGHGAGSDDVAVVVMAERPYAEGKGDDPRLALREVDVAAFRAARASARRVVVVLLVGRPVMLAPILDEADAIVVAWLPGTEGDGVADVLFGEHAPTGKLPHSWPRNIAQVPINVGDADYDPLFPYGFGLTY